MSDHKDVNLTPEERRIQEALKSMSEAQPRPDHEAKLRELFTTGHIDSESRPAALPIEDRSRRGRWLLAAILPVVALAVFFAVTGDKEPQWLVHDVQGQGTVKIDGVAADLNDRQKVQELVAGGASVIEVEGGTLELILEETMVMGMIPGTRVILPGTKVDAEGRFTAKVSGGELMVMTGPGFPGSELLVVTAEGQIEVTGTIIAVNKMPELTCVCVLEGTALIGKSPEDMEEIPAGQRKVMFADERPSMIVDIEPGHQQDLLKFRARNQGTFTGQEEH